MPFMPANTQLLPNEPEAVEDADPVRVGEYYRVRFVTTVHAARPWHGVDIPVLGELHEDGETIGFPWPHYHVDWRFMPQSFIDDVSRGLSEEFRSHPAKRPPYKNALLGLVVLNDHVTGAPVRRVLACQRARHEAWDDNAHWLPRLERAYSGSRLRVRRVEKEARALPDMREGGEVGPDDPTGLRVARGFRGFPPASTFEDSHCPHRGISLVGAAEEDGAVVCPGHGLAWDCRSGCLRPRGLLNEGLRRLESWTGKGESEVKP